MSRFNNEGIGKSNTCTDPVYFAPVLLILDTFEHVETGGGEVE